MAEIPDAPERATVRTDQKVELDLDDAPFLEEEELPDAPPEENPAAGSREAAPKPESAAKAQSLTDRLLARLPARRKKAALAGAVLFVLAATGAGVTFFFSGASRTQPPPQVAERRIVVPDKPPPLPAATSAKHTLKWDDFWVEQKDAEGNIRFLICTFAVPTDSDSLLAEMQGKKLLLRDAVFYYLRNRPLTMLTGKDAESTLKKELMTVFNEHVATGKVEDIYIEQYLIR